MDMFVYKDYEATQFLKYNIKKNKLYHIKTQNEDFLLKGEFIHYKNEIFIFDDGENYDECREADILEVHEVQIMAYPQIF